MLEQVERSNGESDDQLHSVTVVEAPIQSNDQETAQEAPTKPLKAYNVPQLQPASQVNYATCTPSKLMGIRYLVRRIFSAL